MPIALVIEPNSLSNLVTPDALQRCHNYGTRNSYIEGIKYAVEHIAARTNSVAMYIDGGHGGWLGWTSSLQSFAELVKSLQIHLHLRGFALNTANYQPEGEPCPEYVDCNTAVGLDCCVDPCNLLGGSNHVGNNEHNYAIALANEMQLVMNDWTHLHMIIDTSRNGEPNARLQCSNWCNIRDARIGRPPSASTLDTDRVVSWQSTVWNILILVDIMIHACTGRLLLDQASWRVRRMYRISSKHCRSFHSGGPMHALQLDVCINRFDWDTDCRAKRVRLK